MRLVTPERARAQEAAGTEPRMGRESGTLPVLMIVAGAVGAVAGYLASDGRPGVAVIAALLGGLLAAARWGLARGARRAGQRMREERS